MAQNAFMTVPGDPETCPTWNHTQQLMIGTNLAPSKLRMWTDWVFWHFFLSSYQVAWIFKHCKKKKNYKNQLLLYKTSFNPDEVC